MQGVAAIEFEFAVKPDLLRPGEDASPLRGMSFPGGALPWALSRILHAPPKIGNTAGGNTASAGPGGAAVC